MTFLNTRDLDQQANNMIKYIVNNMITIERYYFDTGNGMTWISSITLGEGKMKYTFDEQDYAIEKCQEIFPISTSAHAMDIMEELMSENKESPLGNEYIGHVKLTKGYNKKFSMADVYHRDFPIQDQLEMFESIIDKHYSFDKI
jgi:hypothetical protein